MTRTVRIYTRKGDRGQTRLGDGSRVSKDVQRLECLGAVDELSSCIGLAVSFVAVVDGNPGRVPIPSRDGARPAKLAGSPRDLVVVDGNPGRVPIPSRDGARPAKLAGSPRDLAGWLTRTQRELSGLCAELAMFGNGRPRITARHVVALERAIDTWSARLPPLRAFILPGGGPAAACLHLARTVCRRAERELTRLAAREPVADPVRRYLNRLSDALFVAARFAAQLSGQPETLTSGK